MIKIASLSSAGARSRSLRRASPRTEGADLGFRNGNPQWRVHTRRAVPDFCLCDQRGSNNTFDGIRASSADTAVMVRNSVASYNATGLQAETNAILRVAHSVVTGNPTGVSASGGGTLASYGDNDIDGNKNNNLGVLTRIGMN